VSCVLRWNLPTTSVFSSRVSGIEIKPQSIT
jgi:hypothetical protein